MQYHKIIPSSLGQRSCSLFSAQRFRYTTATSKPFDKIPGPPIHPELGTIADLGARIASSDLVQTSFSYYNDYGPIVRHKLNGMDNIWLYHPHDIAYVYKNDSDIPRGSAGDMLPLTKYCEKRNRKFPIWSLGADWKRARTALQKDIFPLHAAQSYIPMVNEAAGAAVKLYDKQNFSKLLPYTTFDVAGSVVLGKQFYSTAKSLDANRKRDVADEFVDALLSFMVILAKIYLANDGSDEAQNEFDNAMDKMYSHAETLVHESMQRVLKGETGETFIDRVAARKELPTEEIVSNIAAILFAAFDATNVTLQWLLLNLGRFPHIQDKLYNEIHSVLGDDPTVTSKHLEKLDYMKQVIRESFRYSPINQFTTYRILDHPIILQGYEIPAGIRLFFHIYAIQHDPKFIDHPEEFNPDRWSKEEVAKRKGTPKEVIDSVAIAKGFGNGVRMCIGLNFAETQIKTFLCHMLRQWKYQYDPNQQKFKRTLDMFNQPHPYPNMDVKPRKQ